MMVDVRFHSFAGPLTLAELLRGVGIAPTFEGEGPLIEGAEELDTAVAGHIALAGQPHYREALRRTKASVVVVSAAMASETPPGVAAVAVEQPHDVFAAMLDRLYPGDTRGTVLSLLGPHEGLPLTESDVRIGPGVVLGPHVEIGRGTVIGPNTVIGAGVTIGRNATIGSNCSIECAHLGNGVVLHAGVRIGSEGFGWLDLGRTNRKIPQLGRVIVQDRVEIGANSTIDRGALGDTVIGEGTKIDNLVQVGHNCRIGRNCLIAGTAALAGSTVVGDGVMFGGGAASSGHLTIGSGSVLAARSLVTRNLAAGSQVAGYPAEDIREWRRGVAAVRRMNKRTQSGR